ncbi:MAG: helix-turn-helix domain-containing protein [Acetobacteraceae bacterium]
MTKAPSLPRGRIVQQRALPSVVFLDPVTLKPVAQPIVVVQRFEREDYAAAWQKEVGDKARAAREALGISQAELSRRSGLRQSHISLIELGSLDLRVTTLFTLAQTLGVKADRLFPSSARKEPVISARGKELKGRMSQLTSGLPEHLAALPGRRRPTKVS